MVLRILAACVLVFSIGACTNNSPAPSIGCTIESAVSGVVALSIASELQCSNQAAIQASIAVAADKAGICKSPQALAIGQPKVAAADGKPALKSVGSDICNTVASGLLASLVNSSIPSAWGCSASNASASLQALISGACVKAFP